MKFSIVIFPYFFAILPINLLFSVTRRCSGQRWNRNFLKFLFNKVNTCDSAMSRLAHNLTQLEFKKKNSVSRFYICCVMSGQLKQNLIANNITKHLQI